MISGGMALLLVNLKPSSGVLPTSGAGRVSGRNRRERGRVA